MLDIDDRWCDVDFTKEPRARGSLPRIVDETHRYSVAEEVMEQIQEDMWRSEVERLDEAGGGLDRLVVEIKDQKNWPSCVGNATTQLHQILQAAQFGRDRVVQLSAMSLYKQIGNATSGAMIDDALEKGTQIGMLPEDNETNRRRFPHVMGSVEYYQSYPNGWLETAKQFRFDERTVITKLGGMMTCLLRGFPVVVGRAGHSILYTRPVWSKNQWWIKYVNSWGQEWGEGFGEFSGGFGYDSMRLIQESASWAFTCRTVLAPDIFDLSI